MVVRLSEKQKIFPREIKKDKFKIYDERVMEKILNLTESNNSKEDEDNLKDQTPESIQYTKNCIIIII